jgi:hypothetical protein
MNESIQTHSTNNTKHNKYKYTYHQNTHTVVKTPTHYKTHTYTQTLQNKLKQPQYKIHTKWNSHNTIKYPQYKVTLMCMVLLSRRTSLHFTSLHFTSLHFTYSQNKNTSHTSLQLTPHYYTSHDFTFLHLTPAWIPLLVTAFLTLFLNVLCLQGK